MAFRENRRGLHIYRSLARRDYLFLPSSSPEPSVPDIQSTRDLDYAWANLLSLPDFRLTFRFWLRHVTGAPFILLNLVVDVSSCPPFLTQMLLYLWDSISIRQTRNPVVDEALNKGYRHTIRAQALVHWHIPISDGRCPRTSQIENLLYKFTHQ